MRMHERIKERARYMSFYCRFEGFGFVVMMVKIFGHVKLLDKRVFSDVSFSL